LTATDQSPAGRGARTQSDEEVNTVGHDRDRSDDSRRDRGDDRPDRTPRLGASNHLPRVDWIHNTDLERILRGQPEPEF
jgi:hypothetical protein